jgi:hypothetical protein
MQYRTFRIHIHTWRTLGAGKDGVLSRVCDVILRAAAADPHPVLDIIAIYHLHDVPVIMLSPEFPGVG